MPVDGVNLSNLNVSVVGWLNGVKVPAIKNGGIPVSSANDSGQLVQFGDSPSLDAFGRLRISSPITRLDAQFTYGLQPLIYEQLTNGSGAAISHDATNRAASLVLSDTPNGGYAYMQSYENCYYHPGNSQQVFVTFNFQGHTANVTKFAGYGDLSNNGIHFISNGSQLAVRILSNTTNGDNTVLQSAWNLDTLDGSGSASNPSGINLDITKIQILIIDLQALYTGRVRIGFDISGVIYYCHEFLHANVIATPYIQIATLPVICGMSCSNTATSTMLFICSTVRSEGAELDEEGFNFSTEGTGTAGNSIRAHILSVRPKTTFNSINFNRTTFLLEGIEVIVTGNTPILWELCLGQAITGASYSDVNTTYSSFEKTEGTISGSPAIVITQGYVAATAVNKSTFSRTVTSRYPVTLNAAGAVRALGTLSVIATGLGATSACRASLLWRELR